MHAFKMKHLLQNLARMDAGLREHNPPCPSHFFAIVFEIQLTNAGGQMLEPNIGFYKPLLVSQLFIKITRMVRKAQCARCTHMRITITRMACEGQGGRLTALRDG